MLGSFLAFTDGDIWSPGIGDPSVLGWVTVAGYFVAAVLAFLAFRRRRIQQDDAGRWAARFWLLFAAGLVFLAVNKQLDLQTWFTLTARRMAIRQGWYGARQLLQVAFIAGIGLGGIVLAGLAFFRWRQRLREQWLGVLGGLFLGCFVLIRASSFHNVDTLLRMRFAGLKWNWILELGGIALVCAAAWKQSRRAPAAPKDNEPRGQ